MKKRIYFLIASICQIALGIYCMVTSKTLAREQLESIKEAIIIYPKNIQKEIVELATNNGEELIIISTIIYLVVSIIMLIITAKNRVYRKKTLLIVLSVICLLMGQNSVMTLISVATLIISITVKPTKEELAVTESSKKSKKVVPTLEKHPTDKKKIIFGLVLVVIYFSQFLIGKIIPDNLSKTTNIIIDILIYGLLIALSITIFYSELKRDFKAFRKNFPAYLKYCLGKIGIMYVISIALGLICIAISSNAMSANQEGLATFPKLYLFLTAVFYAPIVEESVFRGVIRRLIKNNIFYIATSGILFGVLHVISEPTILDAFAHSLQYIAMGCMFAYVYTKTNNLCSNMLCHMIVNTFASIITILIMM